MPRLHFRNLSKAYGENSVLNNLSFSVNEGEVYGFVGANGAGKSTTMRIALGVVQADSGEVLIDETPINDDLRRHIGYMPEERGLYGKEKIGDQLVYLAALHGVSKKAARQSAEEILERLNLAERINDKLDDLSLGNQQRVQLAASLIHNPRILILDEPFSGLDPVAVEMMADMLLDRASQGVPVLFSSHQLDLVQRLCHRVGILSNGQMVAEGTVNELRSHAPVRFRVETSAQNWIPSYARVVREEGNAVIVETDSWQRDQELLHAALTAGPVHSFSREVPNLNELFREVLAA